MGGWTRASPTLYPHQWSWDSAFIAIGLAHLDTGRAAGELLTLLEHQWKNGKIPHIVFNPDAPPESYFPGPEHWASATDSPDARSVRYQWPPPTTSTRDRGPPHTAGRRGEGRGYCRDQGVPRRGLPETSRLASLPCDSPRPGRLGAGDHLSPMGERHRQLPALDPRAGAGRGRGDTRLRAPRPGSHPRSCGAADRLRVRPLYLAGRGHQACPLRRRRSLPDEPVPGQGRAGERDPGAGERGTTRRGRSRRCPGGRPDDDKGLDRTRAKRAGRTLGPRARPLPRLRRAGRRIPAGPHHRRLRTAHSTGRKRKPPEDPPQGPRITRFHRQPRPPQAAPSEHQPRRRGLQPTQLLARSRLARDELALVVVSGRLGTKEKSGPAQGPRPRATL